MAIAITQWLSTYIEHINASPVTIGVAMILLNIGSRQIMMDITPSQEAFLASAMFRRVLLFVIFFMATRDVVVSAALVIGWWVVVGHLLNEASPYTVIPRRWRGVTAPERPKPEEVDAAWKTIERARRTAEAEAEATQATAAAVNGKNAARRDTFQALSI